MVDSTSTDAGQSVPLDTFYSLLSNPLRRTTLEILENENPPAGLTELATAVAKHHGGGDAVESVRTQLHHVHLPKLATAGVVDYEKRTNTVESCYLERLPRGGIAD